MISGAYARGHERLGSARGAAVAPARAEADGRAARRCACSRNARAPRRSAGGSRTGARSRRARRRPPRGPRSSSVPQAVKALARRRHPLRVGVRGEQRGLLGVGAEAARDGEAMPASLRAAAPCGRKPARRRGASACPGGRRAARRSRHRSASPAGPPAPRPGVSSAVRPGPHGDAPDRRRPGRAARWHRPAHGDPHPGRARRRRRGSRRRPAQMRTPLRARASHGRARGRARGRWPRSRWRGLGAPFSRKGGSNSRG